MRPKRLYYDQDKEKYFYIVKSKRKYIKKPKTMSQQQLVKINIKNIIGDTRPRRVKRRKYKKQIKLQKKIVPELSKALVNEGGLPVYLFRENKKFKSLDDFVKNKDTDDVKLLTNEFKVPPKVEPVKSSAPLASSPPSSPPSTTKKPQSTTKRTQWTFGPDFKSNLKSIVSNWKIVETDEEINQAYQNFIKNVNRPDKTGLTEGKFRTLLKQVQNEKAEDPKKKEEFATSETTPSTKKSFTGSGEDDGLYNDEIEKILKANIKDFVPVIASNEIGDMIRYVKPGLKRFGFIINTSDSSSDGSGMDGKPVGHWRACYVNNEDDYQSIEIFDPLVNEPENGLIDGLRKVARKMNPETLFKVKINYLQRQDKNTGTCGYHAIKFLEDRYNGVPFSVASGYDNYIEKHMPDHSADGEKDLKQKIKKYNSFI
jgi:hypothetical protein